MHICLTSDIFWYCGGSLWGHSKRCRYSPHWCGQQVLPTNEGLDQWASLNSDTPGVSDCLTRGHLSRSIVLATLWHSFLFLLLHHVFLSSCSPHISWPSFLGSCGQQYWRKQVPCQSAGDFVPACQIWLLWRPPGCWSGAHFTGGGDQWLLRWALSSFGAI